MARDQAYGRDPRQVLDVYQPTARTGAPVVIFVHGGAYTASQYENRSTITHIRDGARVPVFVVIAEYEQPGLDVLGGDLLSELCRRDGSCPRFLRLNGHNHMSEMLAFNTPEEHLGR